VMAAQKRGIVGAGKGSPMDARAWRTRMNADEPRWQRGCGRDDVSCDVYEKTQCKRKRPVWFEHKFISQGPDFLAPVRSTFPRSRNYSAMRRAPFYGRIHDKRATDLLADFQTSLSKA
jgi:hypothetical protein